MILAGDIGGTNTRLAIFDDHLHPLAPPQKFTTGDGSQLDWQIQSVLKTAPHPITRGCLAIAGPVIEGICHSTNIGRKFVETEIARAAGLKKLTLINDLVANASGIELLDAHEIVTLLPGESHEGTRAVVSPGTGLGESLLIFDGHHHRAQPSEGGHCRFAATTPDEIGLCQFLLKKKGDSIVEHVISGQGIENVYDYYIAAGRKPSAEIAAEVSAAAVGKRGAIISAAALSNRCSVCTDVMKLFVHALAIECAAIAVKTFAIGGVYIGGGIPPKILPLLQAGAFATAFTTHITMQQFLERVPVRVILNDDTALEGAALYGNRFG